MSVGNTGSRLIGNPNLAKRDFLTEFFSRRRTRRAVPSIDFRAMLPVKPSEIITSALPFGISCGSI